MKVKVLLSVAVRPCFSVCPRALQCMGLQSHFSTRRYGTVTHQPPELLVAGKLTPAADIYSLGIMSKSCRHGMVLSFCTVLL